MKMSVNEYEDEVVDFNVALEEICPNRVCEICKGEVTYLDLILLGICPSCYISGRDYEAKSDSLSIY